MLIIRLSFCPIVLCYLHTFLALIDWADNSKYSVGMDLYRISVQQTENDRGVCGTLIES